MHDLNSLLSSVLAASGLNTTGSRVKVTLQLNPGEPRVWCTEERMKQVFINLVANDLDAMPQEGHLTIFTGVAGDRVEIKFADTGIGIPPENLERVFDTFSPANLRREGLEWGLPQAAGPWNDTKTPYPWTAR